jgi:hypothetical protein
MVLIEVWEPKGEEQEQQQAILDLHQDWKFNKLRWLHVRILPTNNASCPRLAALSLYGYLSRDMSSP